MATAIVVRRRTFRSRKPAQAGFSLLEVVVSMAILTVGMVSLLGVFGLAMASTQTSQQDMIAKQLANEAYESVVTARNTAQTSWDQINNVNSTYCSPGVSNCGIFLSNYQPMYFAGADGIFGTADDAAAGEEYLTDPGVDGLYNTSDDVQIPLTNYQRQIVIGPVYDSSTNLIASLRSVTITVRYATAQNQTQRTYTVNSFISQFQ
jgi:prepilin-type N-terminal cleavage/methylation domain-containing protein